VADLVEHPGAVLGSFPKEFLALPREVLVTTLRHHQKSFSTETDEGLSNRFLVVADTDRDAEGHIRKGNEWVVVGRLEDARFFWQETARSPSPRAARSSST
jgi:glycyl-tRNA synthetase beta chain